MIRGFRYAVTILMFGAMLYLILAVDVRSTHDLTVIATRTHQRFVVVVNQVNEALKVQQTAINELARLGALRTQVHTEEMKLLEQQIYILEFELKELHHRTDPKRGERAPRTDPNQEYEL